MYLVVWVLLSSDFETSALNENFRIN